MYYLLLIVLLYLLLLFFFTKFLYILIFTISYHSIIFRIFNLQSFRHSFILLFLKFTYLLIGCKSSFSSTIYLPTTIQINITINLKLLLLMLYLRFLINLLISTLLSITKYNK